VRIEAPPGWPVIAPWPEVEPGVLAPGSWQAVQDDLIAIGGWNVTRQDAGGVDLAIAFAADRPELEQVVVGRIGPIVAREVELFGGPQSPVYLFLFCDPDQSGYGGSPRTSSMTLFVSPELPLDFAADGVSHLIAHEYHHTWLKAVGLDPAGLRFFAEGFTDWYAALVPWWLGFREQREVEAELEARLAEFEHGLARFDGSLLEAGGPAFFEGGRSSAYRTTYAGGLVLAAWLDLAIARADDGSSLDELMRDLYEDPRWAEGVGVQLDDLVALAERYAGPELAAELHTAATARAPLDLVALFARVGVELEREVVPPSFALRANLDGTRVLTIDPQDLLARCGVRNGDRLVSIADRAVGDEAELRAAWGALAGDRAGAERVRLVVVRADSDEPVDIDVPLPETAVYRLPAGTLTPCRR
jgi:predicted metalloprotease with PDZ domain